MSAALTSNNPNRTTRLSTLVSAAEADQIAKQAAAAGFSVSSYLRDRALGTPAQPDEAAALRQFDTLIERMQSDLDSAIAELSATLARMDQTA